MGTNSVPERPTGRAFVKRLFGILTLSLVAAACGGDSSDGIETTASPTTASPTTATTLAGATTTTSQPSADTGSSVVAPDWTLARVGNGIKPVLALDADDRPAIAWLVEELSEGFVSYASAAEGWSEERFVEGYFYGPIGLAFDPGGSPHIAYHDHQADTFQDDLGDLTHAVRAEAVRAEGAWTVDAATDDGHDGWDSTIAIGSDGVVRAAGIDPQQFGSQQGVEYYELSNDGWVVTAIGSGPIEYEWNVSLAISSTGRVALTYYDNNTRQLVFAELVDDEWQFDVVDENGDAGRFSSLAFDNDGAPHISYYQADTGTVRYATSGGNGWVVEDVGTLSDVEISFAGARRITAIDIDSTGAPHIVFGDQGVVRYGSLTGSGWEVSDILSTGDRPFGQLVTFVLDGEDTPHIATYEGTAADSETAEIVYLTKP